MADFAAVLRKTIDGLAEHTPAMREKVYEKARATVAAKLSAISPPPPAGVADRQKQALEDAIRQVEAGYAGTGSDPFAELENVFAEAQTRPEPAPPPVEAKPQPAATRPSSTDALPGSQVDPIPWQGTAFQAEPTPVEEVATHSAVAYDGDDGSEDEADGIEEEPERRRTFMPLIAAAIVLALILGGGYAVWLNKDDLLAMLGTGGETAVATAPSVDDTAPINPPPAPASKSSVNEDEAEAAQKFTQRLNTDGTEVDPGPAGGVASIGEGTSVAAVTQPPAPATDTTTTGPADADAAGIPAAGTATDANAAGETSATETAGEGQVAVGQKAIFYEERTNVADGSAESGNVVWSLVQESPGDGRPPEAAIHGEATIPGKDLELRVTIRRNADKTLPASHIIELIFLTPDDFDGGGIDKILRFALKDTEEAPGNALLSIAPTKVGDGYFLVALNDTKAEIETNMTLLRREQWIDVPVVYENGRRALITMEKGIPGDKVFDEAIKAWQAASASAG